MALVPSVQVYDSDKIIPSVCREDVLQRVQPCGRWMCGRSATVVVSNRSTLRKKKKVKDTKPRKASGFKILTIGHRVALPNPCHPVGSASTRTLQNRKQVG